MLEGLIYGGFPGFAKRMAQDVAQLPENYLRITGIIVLAMGVGVVWLVKSGTAV